MYFDPYSLITGSNSSDAPRFQAVASAHEGSRPISDTNPTVMQTNQVYQPTNPSSYRAESAPYLDCTHQNQNPPHNQSANLAHPVTYHNVQHCNRHQQPTSHQQQFYSLLSSSGTGPESVPITVENGQSFMGYENILGDNQAFNQNNHRCNCNKCDPLFWCPDQTAGPILLSPTKFNSNNYIQQASLLADMTQTGPNSPNDKENCASSTYSQSSASSSFDDELNSRPFNYCQQQNNYPSQQSQFQQLSASQISTSTTSSQTMEIVRRVRELELDTCDSFVGGANVFRNSVMGRTAGITATTTTSSCYCCCGSGSGSSGCCNSSCCSGGSPTSGFKSNHYQASVFDESSLVGSDELSSTTTKTTTANTSDDLLVYQFLDEDDNEINSPNQANNIPRERAAFTSTPVRCLLLADPNGRLHLATNGPTTSPVGATRPRARSSANQTAGRRRKRADQISQLEVAFQRTPMLDPIQREELARRLDLDTEEVRLWFKYRRQQYREMKQLAHKPSLGPRSRCLEKRNVRPKLRSTSP